VKILIAYNTCWYVFNFRRPLIRALLAAGYEVTVLAPRDEYTDRVMETGAAFRDIAIDSKGNNPLKDLGTIVAFFRAYRELKPDLVLQYTIKPNLYGSIAARFLRIPAVCNITGLGAAFNRGGITEAVARLLYRASFSSVRRVFFQNPDDYGLFLSSGLVKEAQADLLPGSGVDTDRFAPSPGPRPDGPFSFLFIGRLLKEKGVEDLIAAARLARAEAPELRFRLLGRFDPTDAHTADPALVRAAADDGTIELLGETDDVRPIIRAADCVVLPSYYREGTPRSLLEAIASGKPVVAADSVGTREPVRDGVNGFLHRPRDPADLAAKILAMARQDGAALADMGAASRAYALERFREEIVIEKYLEIVAACVNGTRP